MSGIRFCPRCRRASPSEAAYCYYDGQDLHLVLPGLLEPWELGKEFVFPSGQRCRTFDELVAACMEDWPTARELLRQGALHQFFSSIGRADIAQAAWRAVQESVDWDEALDAFLAALPTREAARPELDLTPRHLQFGRVIAGDSRTLLLRIVNRGRRLLHGRLRLEGCSWLSVEGLELEMGRSGKRQSLRNAALAPANNVHPPSADGIPVAELVAWPDGQGVTPAAQKEEAPLSADEQFASAALLRSYPQTVSYRLRVWKQQELRVSVTTANLVAGQSYHTRLIVETNGGIAEIPVDVQVGAIPFAHEPFRGFADPKYLAAQMRTRAKDGARLLREGVVRQWFEQNNWIWPVAGETAPGIAAVQQFYEALGVIKPPRLEINPTRLQFTVQSEEATTRVVEYRSPDPRWVYAAVSVDVHWLRVAALGDQSQQPSTPTPTAAEEQAESKRIWIYGPQKTSFAVTVLPQELPRPGHYQAEVVLEGNGGQKLTLPVCVDFPEPKLQLTVYLLLGSLVFGLAGALLRLLLAWPDLCGLERTRNWRAFASLVQQEVGTG
ncbi:hypothetical protein HRbin36_01129 [bacterium HR36]|nr:hypothetical protein HRbin36_01129 [bacterium HR36]